MVNYPAIKEELDSCKNPLFLFHDDTDGLCSFMQLYHYKKEGHWAIVKSRPLISEAFLRKVMEYEPDKIFVLDVAEIEHNFAEQAKRQIVWIDHHEPLEVDNVKRFNPRLDNPPENIPASVLCYNALDKTPEAMPWLAMAGAVGDWHLPTWKEDFCRKYPALLDNSVTKPEVALFEAPIGKLAKVLQFVIKGQMKDVRKNIAALLKIKDPFEILNQTTETGAYIYRRFATVNKGYEELWNELQKQKSADKLLVFAYTEDKTSFTGELATEAIYRYPEKIIIICREKSGEMRCSLRSSGIQILPLLKKALVGIQGYGGGHEYACGAGIKKEDFQRFVNNIREELINSGKIQIPHD